MSSSWRRDSRFTIELFYFSFPVAFSFPDFFQESCTLLQKLLIRFFCSPDCGPHKRIILLAFLVSPNKPRLSMVRHHHKPPRLRVQKRPAFPFQRLYFILIPS